MPASGFTSPIELPNVTLAKDVENYNGQTPEPGDRWSYGDWRPLSRYDDRTEATHVLLDYATYSDYSGASWHASNYRSLLRDYPETFIDVYGGHGTCALMLPVDLSHVPEDDRQDLLDILTGLGDDYPVYDEEDMSAYEMETAEEAWEQYLGSDVAHELDRDYGIDFDAYDDDELREAYYELTYAQDYGPEMETATDIVFPFNDAVVETIADRISTGQPLVRREVPGQLAI